MKTTFIINFLATSLASGGALFEAPNDWNALELPNPSPSKIALIEGFVSPDDSIRVTVSQSGPIRYIQDADAMIQGHLDYLAEGKYRHEATESTRVGPYKAREVRGEITRKDNSVTYRVNNYFVFTSSAVISLGIFFDAAKSPNFTVDELLKRVKVPGDPITLVSDPNPSPNAYLVGRRIGQAIEYIIIAAIVILVIRQLVTKLKRS